MIIYPFARDIVNIGGSSNHTAERSRGLNQMVAKRLGIRSRCLAKLVGEKLDKSLVIQAPLATGTKTHTEQLTIIESIKERDKEYA
jgi:hypothetical protein